MDTDNSMLLLGVGGGGCRLVQEAGKLYGPGMRVVCVDTDSATSRNGMPEGQKFLLIGGSRLSGHGAGGDAVRGRLAAQDDRKELAALLDGVRTVVLITCLGGGTGGGAAAEIAHELYSNGVTVLCFALLPFSFEGEARNTSAVQLLPLLESNTASLVRVPQDSLFADAGAERMDELLERSNGIIAAGVSMLWRSVNSPGFIALDPQRMHDMISIGGNARFGFSVSDAEDRAEVAVRELLECNLLEKGSAIRKSQAVMLGIMAGGDLRLAEIGSIMKSLRAVCPPNCRIELGTVLDSRFDGRIELVALAFEPWRESGTKSAAAHKSAETGSTGPGGEPPPVAVAPPLSSVRRTPKSRGGNSKLNVVVGKGRFQHVEATIYNGQDLDVPTYSRRGIILER